MKLTFIYSLTIIVLLTFGVEAAVIAKVDPPKNKKVVLVRPSRPHVKVFQPTHIKRSYIWIEGYWKWNRKVGNYLWVNGHLIKNKKGKSWVNGYWKPLNGGWVYSSGKWA